MNRGYGMPPSRANTFGTSQRDPFLARLERTEAYEATTAAQPAKISKAEALKRAVINNPITLDNWQARSKAMGVLHVKNEAYEMARKERLQQEVAAKEMSTQERMSAQARRNQEGEGQAIGREHAQMQMQQQKQQQQMQMQMQMQRPQPSSASPASADQVMQD